jgi:hypothetical protein
MTLSQHVQDFQANQGKHRDTSLPGRQNLT